MQRVCYYYSVPSFFSYSTPYTQQPIAGWMYFRLFFSSPFYPPPHQKKRIVGLCVSQPMMMMMMMERDCELCGPAASATTMPGFTRDSSLWTVFIVSFRSIECMREVYIHTCIVQSTNNSAGSAVSPGPFSFKIIIDELLAFNCCIKYRWFSILSFSFCFVLFSDNIYIWFMPFEGCCALEGRPFFYAGDFFFLFRYILF